MLGLKRFIFYFSRPRHTWNYYLEYDWNGCGLALCVYYSLICTIARPMDSFRKSSLDLEKYVGWRMKSWRNNSRIKMFRAFYSSQFPLNVKIHGNWHCGIAHNHRHQKKIYCSIWALAFSLILFFAFLNPIFTVQVV